MRYWAICVLQLFVNQVVTSWILKLTLSFWSRCFFYMTKKSWQKLKYFENVKSRMKKVEGWRPATLLQIKFVHRYVSQTLLTFPYSFCRFLQVSRSFTKVILPFTWSYINIAGAVVFSEIPFSKNLYHIETSLLISNANQPSAFYTIEFLLKAIFEQTILIWGKFFRISSKIYQPRPQSFLPLWHWTTVQKLSKTIVQYQKSKKPSSTEQRE